ncbi:MAG: MBL fold metallo-hydrolase [Methanospirillaceae archaeon]|nr:MBL fold metallo-hydrolase [Methanospirillaceae archaeon]
MRILNLTKKSITYTSNVYLIMDDTGNTNAMTTLIDVGRDPGILPLLVDILNTNSVSVDQVILTHLHFDHVSLLPAIIDMYHPRICAFSDNREGINHLVVDGESVLIGDRSAEVIHLPGHTCNSICLYCREEKILFSGDNALYFWNTSNTFERPFIHAYQRICANDISVIYPGHGDPLSHDCNRLLAESLRNVLKSPVIGDV